MKRRGNLRTEQLRQALAQEAARLMAEQGIEDFLLAKRKAAERLFVSDASVLPKNAEIEAALAEHQRLFHAQLHDTQLRTLRRTAQRLMRTLKPFEPRLVGSVLSGTASANSEINLHVFADQPEHVALHLLEHGIEHQHAEKKLRYESDRLIGYPSFKFVAGKHAIEVVVFPVNGIRQAPLSPVDGKPMQRAPIAELDTLLSDDS
jgi:hypothetical protein